MHIRNIQRRACSNQHPCFPGRDVRWVAIYRAGQAKGIWIQRKPRREESLFPQGSCKWNLLNSLVECAS